MPPLQPNFAVPRIALAVETCETFHVPHLADLKLLLEETFSMEGCVPTLLANGRALAINYTNTKVLGGLNEANLRDGKRKEKITGFIANDRRARTGSRDSVFRVDPLTVSVPDATYRITLALPFGETDTPEHIRMHSEVAGAVNCLIPEVRYRKGRPDEAVRMSENIVTTWLQERQTHALAGETLSMTRYEIDQKVSALKVRFWDSVPVTYPWLDLYMRFRYESPQHFWPSWLRMSEEGSKQGSGGKSDIPERDHLRFAS